MTTKTIHLDDSGQQYDIFFEREISREECVEIVSMFKPVSVIRHRKADIFVIIVDAN